MTATPAPPPARSSDMCRRLVRRQATYAAFLSAARTVFATVGYTDATIDTIAQAAGYSKGAFYFHFASKEAIFFEALWEQARSDQRVLVVTETGTSTRPPDLLRAIARFLSPGDADPTRGALLLESWSHATRNPRARAVVAAIAAFRRRALRDALAAATDAGYIRPAMDLDVCADLLVTISDGFVARAGSGAEDAGGGQSLAELIAGTLGIPRRAAASSRGVVRRASAPAMSAA